MARQTMGFPRYTLTGAAVLVVALACLQDKRLLRVGDGARCGYRAV